MRHIIRNALAMALLTTALAQGSAAAQDPPLTLQQCLGESHAMITNGSSMITQADTRVTQLQSQMGSACASTSTAAACAALELPLGLAQSGAAAGAGLVQLGEMILKSCPQIVDLAERQARVCPADLQLYQAQKKMADAFEAMAAGSIMNPGGAATASANAAVMKRQMNQTRADMVALACPNTP